MRDKVILRALVAELKAANLPVAGVSIGKFEDRATWKASFLTYPTPQQENQAKQIIVAFVEPVPDDTDNLTNNQKTMLIAAALLGGANPQQAKARAMAAYKQALGIQ